MLNSTNNINIAPYFKLSEFACPCCNLVMLHPKLLAKLVELRNILERPVYINSGYRCSKYNQKVGGVPNSYHRIGFYEKRDFLHLDVRPTKRSRWRE